MTPPHDWDRTPTAAEARRWQLLAAGRRVILERGLDAFTVDDVVRSAGLAKGSFFNYFGSRDLFLDALRFALAEDLGEAARAAAQGSWDGLFARIMRTARDWLIENRELRGLFGVNYMADPTRASRDPLVEVVADILRAGIDAGVVRGVDSADDESGLDRSAQMVLDVLREAAARATTTPDDDTSIAAAETFLAAALGLDARAAKKATYEAT